MSTIIDTVLSRPANLRDLGGIPVAGGVIAEGFAIRSDDLATVTPEFANELVEGGLGAIIDLRSSDEFGATGRGPFGEQPVTYHHVPLMRSISAASMPAFEPGTIPPMGELYPLMFERAAGQLVAALGIMAYSTGAVAFHCAAGRDRTGVLAASLLLALGASDEVIVADYELTHANMAGVGERTRASLGAVMKKLGYDTDVAARAAAIDFSADRAMEVTLRTLRERHGDPLTPLRAVGLSDGLVARLRERAGLA
ncbi:MAG: tyrosine-protein phosphatase [Salinibacterium sp.]|nr:tyrosine-protein phosphatase [Salinibacterium sp.]MBF0672691.1 tyrosine-protein phosphatase [Salinibacterium sp.]